MAKAAPFVPKAPLEKLPLAARKDIRDNYESKKAEYESQISELLGTPFVLNINANEVWAYNPPDSSSSPGGIFTGYVDGFIYALKSFIDAHGDEGKTHFNEAVSQSELVLAVNELGDKAEAISADVKNGVFRILFHHQRLGYNQSYLTESLLKAIEDVPRQGFSIVAKTSIENDYNTEIEELTAKIGSILAMPDVTLDPNFEENYAALTVKSDTSWHNNFGKVAFEYFADGLKYNLIREGFEGDDMLQEGLAEVVTSKTFRLRVVKATTKGTTTETVIEDGVVYLQTTPERWWYNVSDMGSDLMGLL